MNILFTGATSLAGSAFFADLEREGHTVIALSRRPLSSTSIVVDLTVEGAEKQLPDSLFDALIHFAAFVPPDERADAWEACSRVNLDGTIRLLTWARGRVSKILLASTCAVYGSGHLVLPIPEEAALHPGTDYALTKYGQEQLAQAFCSVENIPCVILRLGYVYGPRISGHRAVVQLLKRVRAQESISVLTGESPALPLIHVEDVSLIGRRLLNNGSGIYNLSSPGAISVIDYVQTAMDLLGKTCSLEYAPRPLRQTHWYSMEKLKARHGLEPRVSLRQGIQTLLDDSALWKS